MKMMTHRLSCLLLLVLSVVVFAGCGGGREEGRVVQPPPPDAKLILEEIASTGQLTAHKDRLYEELQGLGESRPEGAEEMMADYEQLTSLSDTAAIKAKASEMAAKL